MKARKSGIKAKMEMFYVDDAIARETLRRRIQKYTRLPKGWYFGAGKPTDKLALDAAHKLINELFRFSIKGIEAFPDPAGAIMISAKSEHRSADIVVSDAARYDYLLEEDDSEIAEGVCCSLTAMISKLEDAGWKARTTSGSPTPFTTATRKIDSRALPLEPAMRLFPSSMKRVPSAQAEAFAFILKRTTEQSFREILQSSSELHDQVFRTTMQNEILPKETIVTLT